MSPLAIGAIVVGSYAVVCVFTYALMKMASDADDAIEAMSQTAITEEDHVD